MRINDEILLREMKKDADKTKRVNSYKVNYMQHNGQYTELTFKQGYDHSNDIYNPFFIRVYNKDGYITSGSGPTIEKSYNSLITSLIMYMSEAKQKRDEYNSRLSQIAKITMNDEDEIDDRF